MSEKMSETFATPRSDVPRRTIRYDTPRAAQSPFGTTQKNASRRLSAAFKSPLRQSNENSPQHSTADEETRLEQELTALRERVAQQDREIESLHAIGCQEKELKDHIQKLHDYNEIKDIGQMLLGRIAVLQGVTTKDLYEKYSLSLDD